MERADTLIIGGAVIGVVLLYFAARRTDAAFVDETGAYYAPDGLGIFEGAQAIAQDIVTTVKSGVRGIRNNNPGNIELTGDKWVGLSPTQTDGRFAQFTEMRWGVRALAITLKNYDRKYGLDTVRGIINRWAPSVENNTGAYVNAVAQAVGVSPEATIDLDDRDTMFRLVRAIIAHENGRAAALLVSDTAVYQGIDAA